MLQISGSEATKFLAAAIFFHFFLQAARVTFLLQISGSVFSSWQNRKPTSFFVVLSFLVGVLVMLSHPV